MQKLILFVFLFHISLLFADEVKIMPDNGKAGDYFGCATAISSDYAIIGAYHDSTNGEQAGTAYVYHYETNAWNLEQKILASDADVKDWFGYVVDIDGDFAIIGAEGDDDLATNSGAAYIFHYNGTSWQQQAKLLPGDGAIQEARFGCSVSISGNYAIVGCKYDDDNGDKSGSAYIYYYNGSEWTQQQKILSGYIKSKEYFGNAVSINGNYAVVGAWGSTYYDNNGWFCTEAGAVYVYKNDGSAWNLMQMIRPVNKWGKTLYHFGWSVDIDDKYIITGAKRRGWTYIYHLENDNWNEQTVLKFDDEGGQQNKFGHAIAIHGNYALVSAPYDYYENAYKEKGSVYAFLRQDTTWTHTKYIQASDAAGSDHFGWSVAISENHALIGSIDDDNNSGENAGAAYIYECQSDLNLSVPVVSDIPDQKKAEGQIFAKINLDDFVEDPGATDDEISWEYTGNSDLIINITGNRIAEISAPFADWYGSETITFTATNPGSISDSDTAQFTLTPVNDAPEIIGLPDTLLIYMNDSKKFCMADYASDVDTFDSLLVWTIDKSSSEISITYEQQSDTLTIQAYTASADVQLFFILTDDSGAYDKDTMLVQVRDPAMFTPQISPIPDQTITTGQIFDSIHLDDFVTDGDNNKNELVWSYAGNLQLIVSIDKQRVAHIAAPSAEWFGDESVVFTVEDPNHLSDRDTVHFTVLDINDPPEIINLFPDIFLSSNHNKKINLKPFTKDIDTPDSLLIWTFKTSAEDISCEYNEAKETLTISASNKNGRFALFLTLTDDSAAFDCDTIIVHVNDMEKIILENEQEGDLFGNRLSLDGENLLVTKGNEYAKQAYIYKQDGLSWVQDVELTPSTGFRFGYSADIYGDYAIIGAPTTINPNYYNRDTGAAIIFYYNGTQWTEQTVLFPHDPMAFTQWYGSDVCINDKFAFVGCWADYDMGDKAGAVYVYKRNGANWSFHQKLTASDGEKYDHFSSDLSLDGNILVAGSKFDDDLGEASGSAYIFELEGGQWIEKQKILASDGEDNERFGGAISIKGDNLVIGSILDDDLGEASGSVYIFKLEGGQWIEKQKILCSGGKENDKFGRSVILSEDFLLVSSLENNENGESSGAAYLYSKTLDQWQLEARLTAPDGKDSDYFGASLALKENTAFISAPSTDYVNENTGSFYIYNHTNGFVPIEDYSEKVQLPKKASLFQNYPNPFNPTTAISYWLPVGSHVELNVYNLLGEKVANLVNKTQAAGTYTVEFNGAGLPSGVYVYRIRTASGFIQTKKMILLK